MPKYQVTIEEKVYRTVDVNAADEIEAEKIARELYENDLSAFIINDWGIESTNVLEIVKSKQSNG